MERFSLNPAPLFVEIERIADIIDDPEPDRVDLTLYRGEVKLGSTEVYRGELLECFDDQITVSERHQVNGVLAAEWRKWDEEDRKPATDIIDLVEALKQSLAAVEGV